MWCRDSCAGGQLLPLASTQPADDASLRLLYSMAIVRLVNGIADSAQKGRTAVSVASLAAQAGAHCACSDVTTFSAHISALACSMYTSTRLSHSGLDTHLQWLRIPLWS